MDSKFFSCWVEGGVIQIKGQTKSVVMRGTKQGNLYILQVFTMLSFVSIVDKSGAMCPMARPMIIFLAFTYRPHK